MSAAAPADVLALPFDQYQRYRLVSDLLGALRPPGARLQVLDVGGRTALLRRFLEDPVTLVDLEPSGEPGLVLGDGAHLPFQGGSFDVVTAFDTLEHVPPPLRERFVAECRRVARRHVVLAGPYEAPRVVEAERLLQRFLREKLGVEHRYLEEHRHNGLPDRAAVEGWLRAAGGAVASFGHGNLERWLALMCLSLYLDEDPALRDLAAAVHGFYNAALYASDHAAPVYRHAVVAAFEGAPLPRVEHLLAPPVAPPGALEPFTELAGELVAFDRERAAWREERARLARTNETLREDLAGHRGTLAELREELDARGRLVAELEAELARERREGADQRAKLEQAAAGHLDVARGLEGELKATQAAAREIEAEAHRLQAALAERERRLAELQATLRRRLDNLKRALGPKPRG